MKWKPLTVNKLIACMDKGTTCFVCKGDREEYDYFKIIRVSKYRDGNCFVHRLFLNGNINRFPSHLVGTCKSQAYALRRMRNVFKAAKKCLQIVTKPRTDAEVHGDTDKHLPVYTSPICGNIDELQIDSKPLGPRFNSDFHECIDKELSVYYVSIRGVSIQIQKGRIIQEGSYDECNCCTTYLFCSELDGDICTIRERESLFYAKEDALHYVSLMWKG